MKKILLTLLFITCLVANVPAAVFTSATTGNWNDGGTWGNTSPGVEGTDYPGSGDTATIASPHTVTIVGTTPSSGGLLSLTIDAGGKLSFSSTATTSFTVSGAGATISVSGDLEIGTTGTPIPSNYTATLDFNPSGNTNWLFNSGSNFSLQGASKTYYKTTLSSTVTAGDKYFITADTTGWAVDDEILLDKTSSSGGTEIVTVTGISGATIYIDSNGDGTGASPTFTYTHETTAYVLNLTRNVVIKNSGTTNSGIRPYGGDADWAAIKNLYVNSNWNQSSNMGAWDYSVFRDSPGAGFEFRNGNGSPFNTSFSNNVIYNTTGSCFSSDFVGTGTPIADSYAIKCNSSGNGWVLDSSRYTEPGTTYFKNLYASDTAGSGFYFAAINAGGSIDLQGYETRFNADNGIFVGGSGYYYFQGGKNYGNSASGVEGQAYGGTHIIYERDSMYGTDGATIHNNGADIANGTTSYAGSYLEYHGHNVDLASTTDISVFRSPRDNEKSSIRISNYGQAGQRALYHVYRGEISDQITGGQTAGWAYGGSGISLLFRPNSTTSSLDWDFYIPVTVSTNPQFKFYVRKTSASGNCTLNIDVYDSDDHVTKLINNASIALTDSWTQYSVASISPSVTGNILVTLKATDGGVACDIGIDDMSIVSGAITYTDNLDHWQDGLPQLWLQGAGGGGGGSEHSFTFVQ